MSTIIDNVVNGKYSKKELETLIKNATNKGGHEDIIAACKQELINVSKKPSTVSKRKNSNVAEEKDGYSIMRSAYTKEGDLRHPELIQLAKLISDHPFAQNVAIMKTQIRLYYKDRHMISGIKSNGIFWFGLLDETKITDSTVDQWSHIGTINKGKYFETNYINVQFSDIDQLYKVIDLVLFT